VTRRRAVRALPGAVLALLGAVAAAATVRRPSLDAPRPSGTGPDDVLEAVFRQHVEELLDQEARARGTVICLAVDPGGSPQSVSREFLRRFPGDSAVRRAAECEARPEGAVVLATGGPAVIVTAGPLDWVAADEVWVAAACFRSARSTRRWQYRVVRERAGWVSLGPIIRQAPL
jgi:hypothetical protein